MDGYDVIFGDCKDACGKCNGTGFEDGVPCPECDGTGLIEVVKDNTIEPEVDNG